MIRDGEWRQRVRTDNEEQGGYRGSWTDTEGMDGYRGSGTDTEDQGRIQRIRDGFRGSGTDTEDQGRLQRTRDGEAEKDSIEK